MEEKLFGKASEQLQRSCLREAKQKLSRLYWGCGTSGKRLGRRICAVLLIVICTVFLLRHRVTDIQSGTNDSFLDHIDTDSVLTVPSRKSCTHFSCFDVYRCNALDNYKVTAFMYPETVFLLHGERRIVPEPTAEFKEAEGTIRSSQLYTGDPINACIFVPPVDLLFPDAFQHRNISSALASLTWWDGGRNHLVFTMQPLLTFANSDLHLGSAMVAGPGYSAPNFRRGFDVSIPFHFPSSRKRGWPNRSRANRRWLLMVLTVGLHDTDHHLYYKKLSADYPKHILHVSLCAGAEGELFDLCTPRSSWKYPDILLDARFCMLAQPYESFLLGDLLMMGCVPVVFDSGVVLPFDDTLDWARSVAWIRQDQTEVIVDLLDAIDSKTVTKMRKTGLLFWDQYFSSMEAIVQTTLQTLNDRIFPNAAWTYEQWNLPPEQIVRKSPLILSDILMRSPGYTAVILTYDRLDSLFELILNLAKCQNLVKILVIWNNQDKQPPSSEFWPQTLKPLKVIQTKENKLTNRFVPYDDIETEAVLSLDDDILMLTPDEIEFAFQVWLENSDRLVGFPSRLHLWNSSVELWEYNSEWSSRLSLILTGAAFYNKIYGHYFTQKMPRAMRAYVNNNVNCEDIAMNFLIANMTGKGTIKIGPRKKFRCPQCSNMDMLSADATHLSARSRCINYFVAKYGFMPLINVEYRADPVLFKQKVSVTEQRFRSIGDL